jgi:hypothetical protein
MSRAWIPSTAFHVLMVHQIQSSLITWRQLPYHAFWVGVFIKLSSTHKITHVYSFMPSMCYSCWTPWLRVAISSALDSLDKPSKSRDNYESASNLFIHWQTSLQSLKYCYFLPLSSSMLLVPSHHKFYSYKLIRGGFDIEKIYMGTDLLFSIYIGTDL